MRAKADRQAMDVLAMLRTTSFNLRALAVSMRPPASVGIPSVIHEKIGETADLLEATADAQIRAIEIVGSLIEADR